jgi:hypothetical protein
MADSQPTTPEALAAKTGCHPRLVREWLNAQAASGYMTHDKGLFVLPEEQAMALALEDSPAYMAGGAAVIAALFHDKDKLVAAMRGDGCGDAGDCGEVLRLTEVAKALLATIDNPEVTVKELSKIVTGPDFPTAGLIVGREGIKKAYETGRGQVVMRANILPGNIGTKLLIAIAGTIKDEASF